MATPSRPLARRLDPPTRRAAPAPDAGREVHRPERRPASRRRPAPRPTRGPGGEVRWWERPAPGGDDALWEAVQRLQRRRLQLSVSVCELARRLDELGHPISRETLSRLLNGKQPTSWPTVRAIAEVLSADVPQQPGPS